MAPFNTMYDKENLGIYVLLRVLSFSIVLMFCLLLALCVLLVSRPIPHYYAVPDNYMYLQGSEDGQFFAAQTTQKHPMFRMETLDQPMKSVNEIKELAAITAATSLTFDFFNYYKQLDNIRNRFTKAGWEAFSSSLRSSGLLEAVLKKKLSTSVVVIGSPVLLNRGLLNGSYAWKYQMVVLVTYESSSQKVTKSQVVTIVFKRVPLIGRDAEVGIAVDSFTTSD